MEPSPVDDSSRYRYAAFISYAHADEKWAKWLHRRLEAYRLPRGVVDGGRAKLGRVFLDRSELSSSPNLSDAIADALEASSALIVVCSPRAAQSRWVNEEVRRFRTLANGNRVFCLIVDGDPAGVAAPSPFPPALLQTEEGSPALEPLAADLRPDKDRPREALLKLVAGLLDLPFDALRRRDLVRRQRRLAALATFSTALLVVMTALTIAAVLARREAERQRDTALRTASFMAEMFNQARPDASGADITVLAMLDRSAEDTLTSPDLRDQPETRSMLLTTLADVFAKLGALDRSEALLQAARLPGDTDPERLLAQAALTVDIALQRSDYPKARRAVDAGLALPVGSGLEDQWHRARLLTQSGQIWSAQGMPDRAQADFFRARSVSLEMTPPNRSSATVALLAAALADIESGALQRAHARLRLVIQERQAMGQPLHPNVLTATNSLGALAIKRGDAITAERYFRQAIALQSRVLGDQHLDTATSRSNLGRALVEQRRLAEAKTTLQSARATLVAQGGEHLDVLANLDDSLGLAQAGLGEVTAARATFTRGLAIAREHKMPKRVELLTDWAELECANDRGKVGLPLVTQARAALAELGLPEPWRAARIDVVEGSCLIAIDRRDEAKPLVRRGVAPVVSRWGRDSLFGVSARRLSKQIGRL